MLQIPVADVLQIKYLQHTYCILFSPAFLFFAALLLLYFPLHSEAECYGIVPVSCLGHTRFLPRKLAFPIGGTGVPSLGTSVSTLETGS